MLGAQNSTLASIAIGAGVTLLAAAVLIRWSVPLGLTDHPDPRKHHRAPTPRTAGLALWFMLVVFLALGRSTLPVDRGEWMAVHAMGLLGLLDDRFNLRARYKAVLGLAVAVFLAMDVAPDLGHLVKEVHFLGLNMPDHLLVTVPLLALWFWSVPQAFNLIDGVNGLSMGFSLLLLNVLALVLGRSPSGGGLTGGLVVLLLLNYPKARHFLGDCGSLMLGTLFAILSAKAFVPTDANLMLWVMAYPAIDVALVMTVRAWKGVPLGSADRSHLHHYLIDQFGFRKAWLVPLVLLSLALLPMMRALNFPGHDLISLLGLISLFALAFRALRNRVGPNKAIVPLVPRKELGGASGSNPVA